MKTPFVFFACVAIFAITQTTPAAPPVTGNIGFAGTVTLDTSDVGTATRVVTWGTNTVEGDSGSFTAVSIGTLVNLTNSWPFTSGSISNLWTAGGFTFNLTSSTISLQIPGPVSGYLVVNLQGTVSGNGFAKTAIVGSFTAQDPSPKGFGSMLFTESMSFNTVAPPPNLAITTNGPNSLSILWPTSYYNYTLQQCTNLATTNWLTSTYPITNGFGTNFCSVSPLNGNLFFRLSQ